MCFQVSVDFGTESCRAAVFDADGNILGSGVAAHETSFPRPGWAEQSAEAWWSGLGSSVRAAVESSGCTAENVAAICLDTTSCTVLALDERGDPLRPALLWMDARSAAQAAEILALGAGDPALEVNNGGSGPISAECERIVIRIHAIAALPTCATAACALHSALHCALHCALRCALH